MEFEMEMQEVAIMHRNDEHVVSMTQVYSGVKDMDRSGCLSICPCQVPQDSFSFPPGKLSGQE